MGTQTRDLKKLEPEVTEHTSKEFNTQLQTDVLSSFEKVSTFD